MNDGVRRLSELDAASQLRRFAKLVEMRLAPSLGTLSPLQHEIFWPAPPLEARCLPDGVMSLDQEDGYNYDSKLERFMLNHGGRNVAFWAIGGERNGVFTGEYSLQIRAWLKAELVLSPTIVLSMSEDVFLISDEQLHFTVVGGDAIAIADLEGHFGGPRVLEQNFREWADAGFAGFDGDTRGWAHHYLMRWSGWNGSVADH